MIVGFGKHKGKSLELILLNQPDYVWWTLHVEHASGPLSLLQDEVRKLIDLFDQKTVTKACEGSNCVRTATYCTVYEANITPFWWCETCDPYQMGALRGKLTNIRRYLEAVRYVNLWCRGTKNEYSSLVRSIAEAKGLPKRVGEKQAHAFFHGA